jgi:hypothetical protein
MGEELERTIIDLRRALPPLFRLLDMPVCKTWCWWVRVGTTLSCALPGLLWQLVLATFSAFCHLHLPFQFTGTCLVTGEWQNARGFNVY